MSLTVCLGGLNGPGIAASRLVLDNCDMRNITTIAILFTALWAACDRRPVQKDIPPPHNASDHSKMQHSEMQSSPGADSAPFELQFLDTTIKHHQGAIDMALLAATRAQHAELKTLAKRIIDDQRKEVQQMTQWRARWFGEANPAVNMDIPGMKDGMKGVDLEKLDSLKANDFDLEFIRQMIPHHEDAIAMANDVKPRETYAELKTLSEAIVKAQTAEIEQMRVWQTAWTK